MQADIATLIATYQNLWKQGGKARISLIEEYPGWPDKGIAILGDFSGIQNFVYRPTPGAGGAARRLRSRSFRVSAYTELIARWCLRQFSVSNPKLLYTAGGRFLIASEPFDSWEQRIAYMRCEVDAWAWANFEGELVFHLAAAPFDSARVPNESLNPALELSRKKPLSGALQSPGNWREPEFLRPASPDDARCDSCGVTQRVDRESGVCPICSIDGVVGSRLPQTRFAKVVKAQDAVISALDLAIELNPQDAGSDDGILLSLGTPAKGSEPWFLLRHVPTDGAGHTLDFDQIAMKSPGSRKWLGCLRIDADNVGRHFADLRGDPARIWGLSRLLNQFFANTVESLLGEKFPNIYAVYGGGDDLFVIGPWTDTLEFANSLRERFRACAGEDLTFSAGLALAKPGEHILSMARRAAEELEKAKSSAAYGRSSGRNQIRALQTSCDWKEFPDLLSQAKRVVSWVESGDLPLRFLHRVLELHDAWLVAGARQAASETAASVRYRPLLYYQICRNLKRSGATDWAHSLLRFPSDWPWVGFIVRYAMLAARRY